MGSSMGAATAMAFTLEHPERVPALVQITPAYTGYARTGDVDGDAVGRARRGARQAASTRSWRSRSRATSPSAGAKSPARPPGSGWSATSTWTPWPRRCARCRARLPGRDWSRCRRSRCRCSIVGSQDDSDSLHPLGDRRGVPPQAPERRAGRRGQGRVAAGLAGRAAVERDRGLLRARRLRAVVEHACPGARSSRPPRRPPRSPGDVPIERRASPCSAASSASRAKWRRLSSGSLRERRHRHQAGHGHRAARDEVAELGGRDARLRLLAGHVHLDQHLAGRVLLEPAQRRLGGERVDQPHVRRDVLDLAALERADEVPGEQVAVAPPAWRAGPGRGSRPPARCPASASAGRSSASHVLDGGAGSRPRGPIRSRTRSRFAPSPVQDPSRTMMPAWRPVTPSSRRWEKYRSGSQLVQRSTCCDVARRPPPRAAPRSPRAGRACARRRDARRRPRTRSSTSSPDLVAAAADARARPRRRAAIERAPRAFSMIPPASGRQPQWSIADLLAVRERDREAVGHQHEQAEPGLAR